MYDELRENQSGEPRTYQKVLHEILNDEAIKTDDQLREAQLQYSVAYFIRPSGMSESDALSVIDTQERRIRMYLISQVIGLLYPQSPGSLIECGSAGDISAALALPSTQITSVDEDPQIFLHMPYNLLPREYLKKIGKKGVREYYGGWDLLGGKRRKLEFVKRTVPNLEILMNDANQLQYPDNQFDGAFVQGTPDMFDFLPEMTRVVRPNGYIFGIIHEQSKPKGASSVYKTGRYNQDTYSEHSLVTDERLRKLGLERIPVPDKFRKYENLCEWRDSDGDIKESGFVYEIFKKSDVSSPI